MRAVLFLVMTWFCLPVCAQDDSFFYSEDRLIKDEPREISLAQVMEATSPIRISGSSTLAIGGLFGWPDWTAQPEHREGMLLTQTISIDAKPLPNLSAHSKFQASYPSQSVDLSLSELYVDTVVGGLAFLRMGKGTTSWGGAKVFNVIDLASYSAEGGSIRLSTSWTGGSLTFLATMPVAGWTSTDYSDNANYRSQAWNKSSEAVRLGWVGSGYDLSLAARHNHWDSSVSRSTSEVASSLRFTFFGLDIFDDLVAKTDWTGSAQVSTVAGMLSDRPVSAGAREKVQAYAEYLWDGRMAGADPIQRTSLSVRLYEVGVNRAEIGVQWTCDWTDTSHLILIGYGFDADRGLRLKFGFPISLGSVTETADDVDSIHDLQAALGFKLDAILNY